MSDKTLSEDNGDTKSVKMRNSVHRLIKSEAALQGMTFQELNESLALHGLSEIKAGSLDPKKMTTVI